MLKEEIASIPHSQGPSSRKCRPCWHLNNDPLWPPTFWIFTAIAERKWAGKVWGEILYLFSFEHEAGPPSRKGGQNQNSNNGGSNDTCLRADEKRDIKIYSGLIPIIS